jgi:dihydropteroate synthase
MAFMPQIIGVLNVTPDSYFDGARWSSMDAALKRTEQMLREGADWIEIGGESTGPNSKNVSEQEEIYRTIPVIKEILNNWGSTRISIDTYKSAVAQEALACGVSMVNDVTAGRGDAGMFEAARFAKLVLMYAKDPTPRTTVRPLQYEDVVATITKFLSERIDAAVRAGVPRDRMIIDPGLGHFVSSDPKYSFEIIARLAEFATLGCPILLSPSRKSFLAGPDNLPPADRLEGTIAASAIAVLNGATFIRTHDVAAVKRACALAAQIFEQTP